MPTAEPVGAIERCADDAFTVLVEDTRAARTLADTLRATGDWLEAVAGIDSVVVQFDAAAIESGVAESRLQETLATGIPAVAAETRTLQIPVVYGGTAGPDLSRICEALSLTEDEFIHRHTSAEHTVDLIGFTPGFAYVGGLDAQLHIGRLSEPRRQVAAGSIGIAGSRSGIYALPGPGGWNLIGRTPMTLFEADADAPFVLSAGVRLRFLAITAEDAGF